MTGTERPTWAHEEWPEGMVILVRAALPLQHEEPPPHLHLKNPTPHVDWRSVPVVVPTLRTPWATNGGGPRIAGVSSFGFSGTNAHVVVEEAPPIEGKAGGLDRPLHVLTVSAKTEG